jgi:hypothetical protein
VNGPDLCALAIRMQAMTARPAVLGFIVDACLGIEICGFDAADVLYIHAFIKVWPFRVHLWHQ